MEDILSIMKQVELFRGLTDAQMTRLAMIVQREVYNAEAIIFRQDAPGDKMYIVNTGQVEIRVHDQDRHGHAALFLGRGQVFGEMALVDSGGRSATTVAVEDDTTVFAVNSHDFNTLCQQDSGIGFVLMRNIAQDMSFKLRHRQLDPSEDHS